MNEAKKILVDTLLNDQSHHIEFNGHLTNHNKHAVIALNGLGASLERIKSYYDTYAALTPYGYGLEEPKTSKYTITIANWKQYLGKRTSFSSYCQFFEQQEKKLGMALLLKQYVPILLPGWVGSLTHGAIHLGWALDVNNCWMTIEGLAYMAFSYVSCHPERASLMTQKVDTPLSTFCDIADIWAEENLEMQSWVETIVTRTPEDIHPELARSGLQYRVAQMLATGHPSIYAVPSWIDTLGIPVIWQQLHYLVTLLYKAQPGDFIILHFITSLYAMEKIADRLPADLQRYTIKCFWIGMLCFLFSRGEFPKRSVLEALNSNYKDKVDSENADWEPKRMWKISGYLSIFRIAASYFTTTPELPKSFETAPFIS